ncbi:hypothetical protein C4544_01820, partial [candidate division WS5 bacterium]
MKTMSKTYLLYWGIMILLVYSLADVAKANETYLHYDITTDPSICGDRISDIFYDEINNRVLISTGYFWDPAVTSSWRGASEQYSDGICVLNRNTNTVTKYNVSNSAIPTNVYKSITWGDNLIIAGSYYSGIVVINEITGEIRVFNKNSSPALKTGIYSLETAPISSLKYENGKIYFSYGEYTE